MADIAKTRVGTTDPLDLCQGFFLFGTGFSQGFASSGVIDIPIANTSKQVLAWKLFFRADGGLEMGLCGPSYATVFDVKGSTTGQNLSLTTSNHMSEAGMVLGIGATASLTLTLRQYKLKFKKGKLKGRWSNQLQLNLTFSVDILALLIQLIVKFLGAANESDNGTDAKNSGESTGSISGIQFRARSNATFGGAGNIFLKPSYSYTFDISSYFPALKTFKDGLAKVGGGFGFGPLLGFSIPVTFEPESVTLKQGTATATYTKPSNQSTFAASGTITGVTTDTPLSNPDKITIKLKHTPGIDFFTGFSVGLKVAKVFSLSFSVQVSILDFFGASWTFASRRNDVSNDVGKSNIAVNFVPPSTVMA